MSTIADKMRLMSSDDLLMLYAESRKELALRKIDAQRYVSDRIRTRDVCMFYSPKSNDFVYGKVDKVNPKNIVLTGLNEHNLELTTGSKFNVSPSFLIPLSSSDIDCSDLKDKEPQLNDSTAAAPLSSTGDNW